MSSITLGIVGYGEVGKIFAKGLQRKDGIAGICAWDVNFRAPAIAGAERAHADSHGVRPMQGMAELCEQATLIISAVTASNTLDWERTGAYFFSRVAQHGKRRAEEMRESARTVQEAGFPPIMAAAIADKHDWVAAQAREGVFRDVPADAPWQVWADRLIERNR